MNKPKLIIGLSIVGVIALSGTVLAMNSGTNTAQPVGHGMGGYGPYGNGGGYGMMGSYGTNGISQQSSSNKFQDKY